MGVKMSADTLRFLLSQSRLCVSEWGQLNRGSHPSWGLRPCFVAVTDDGCTTNGRAVNTCIHGLLPHAYLALEDAQAAAREYLLTYHRERPAVITWAAYVRIRRRHLIRALRELRDQIAAMTLRECGEIRMGQFYSVIRGELKRLEIRP